MKTFDQYLNEQKLESVVILLEERNFPFEQMTNWYLTEGYCLSDNELKQIMEGVWAEAEGTFWGDTWRGMAKGAGVGAGAGAAAGGMFGHPWAGGGIGGLLGGAAGGLYGAGRNLWRQWKDKQAQKATPEPATPEPAIDHAAIFKKLAAKRPDLHGDIEALLAKINKSQEMPQEPKDPEEYQARRPLERHPMDMDNLHPAYRRRGVNPIGDHTIQ